MFITHLIECSYAIEAAAPGPESVHWPGAASRAEAGRSAYEAEVTDGHDLLLKRSGTKRRLGEGVGQVMLVIVDLIPLLLDCKNMYSGDEPTEQIASNGCVLLSRHIK